jgi:hypothetical protein
VGDGLGEAAKYRLPVLAVYEGQTSIHGLTVKRLREAGVLLRSGLKAKKGGE